MGVATKTHSRPSFRVVLVSRVWRALGAVVVWLCFGGTGEAQLEQIANLSYEHMEDTTTSVEGHRPAQIGMGIFRVNATAPLPFNEMRSIVLLGLGYAALRPRLSERLPTPRTLHEITFTAGIIQRIAGKWSMVNLGNIGLGSEFHGVDSSHLRVSGSVMFVKRVDEHLSYGFGVGANYRFGELAPAPLFLIDWRPVEAFRLEGVLPTFLRMTGSVQRRFEVFAAVNLEGNRFEVEPKVLDIDNVRYSNITARLGLGVRLWDGLWLTGSVGRTLHRRFDYFVGGNAFENPDIDNAWTGRLALAFRVGAGRGFADESAAEAGAIEAVREQGAAQEQSEQP